MPAVAFDHQLHAAPDGGWVHTRVARNAAAARLLTREHELLLQLPAELFARPLDLVVEDDTTRLRCRVPYPLRLDEVLVRAPPPTPLAALQLCLSMARAVAALHRLGVADRQLAPARFYCHAGEAEGRLCLASLAGLTRPNVEERSAGALAWLEGDLNYLAPEQTGRMNRSVDHRADLYTLGVLFYRLLAGRLPFGGGDELALVHAHLSLLPPPPSSFLPGFEPAWEALLGRLLAKNAEDRYQTAAGVVADLERLAAHACAGTRAPAFEPGADDHGSELSVPSRLYGRDAERQAVLESFAATVAGGKVLLLVAGSSGVGKSSLINEVHKPITAARGTFAGGKFDQFQRDQPYVGVLGALRELARLLLAERDEVVERWRQRLAEALEGEGQVLVDLLPALAPLLPGCPPLPAVGPTEAAARLKRVFQNFIRTVARPEHPLVLFLDDLQWADAASLQLLENLFADARAQHLLVVGAYRDNEVQAGHLLFGCLAHLRALGVEPRTLALRPLPVDSVRALLADTLARPPEQVGGLAELLHDKTAGNPLYLKLLLQSLAERGSLAYDPARRHWTWDHRAIAAEAISGNVVELVLASLRELPASAALALSIGAFLGASFSFDDLAAAANGDLAQLHEDLERLEERRYLLRVYGTGQWRFAHDRIQEAAYRLCPPGEVAARHVQIGHRLAACEADLEASERLFGIVQHLNHAYDDGATPADPLGLARLNYAAGIRAKRSLAHGSAVQFLALACQADLSEDAAFAFDAAFEYAHALFLDGQSRRAMALADALLPRAAGALQAAAVQNLRLTLLCVEARYEEAIDAGRRGLGALGFEFPTGDHDAELRRQLAHVETLLRKVPLQQVPELPLAEDRRVRLALTILKSVLPPAFVSQSPLWRVLCVFSAGLTLEHGLARESPYLLSAYGNVYWLVHDDIARGVDISFTGLATAERFGDKESICLVCESIVGHLSHWRYPLSRSRELTRIGTEAGIEAGEFQFVAYIYAFQGFNLFFQGSALPGLVETLARWADFARPHGNHLAIDGLEAALIGCGLLGAAVPLGDAETLARLEAERMVQWRARSSVVAHLSFAVVRAQIHLLFGELEAALPLVRQVRQANLTEAMPGVISIAVHHLQETVLEARLAPASGPRHDEAVRKVSANLALLERWARASPANFGHYEAAGRAELAALEGRLGVALEQLDRALAAAAAGAMLLDQVWLAERAAELCYRSGDTVRAAGYVRRALDGALALGAARKVEHLYARHPLLAQAAPALAGVSLGERELDRALGIIAAFNRETALEALVALVSKTLLELSGASGFVLVLADEQLSPGRSEDSRLPPREADAVLRDRGQTTMRRWRVRAHSGLEGPAELRFEDAPLDALPGAPARWPQRPLRLVLHGGEALMLDRPADAAEFVDDAYLQACRPGAILCNPLAVGGEPIGAVYLESRLASNVFTANARRWVEILAAQIGISLLNATLVERMEQTVAQRTAALRSANQSLEALAQTLRTLGDVGQQITSQLALEGLLQTLERQVTKLVGAELAVFGPRDDGLPGLTRLNAPAWPAALLAAAAAVADSAAARREETADASAAWLALPLAVRERLVGVIAVRRRAGEPFGQRERLILRTLAAYASIGLDNAAAYQKLDRALRTLHDTQAQLVVTEKLAALGQLTAGVAHEIQNPLNFVNNFAEVSKGLVDELRGRFAAAPLSDAERDDALEVCSLVTENLDTILSNGRRTAAIVRGMLRHSTESRGEPEPTDLNALMRSRVAVLRRSLPVARLAPLVERVRIDWQLDPALPAVPAVAQDIATVLDNLLHNALAALEPKAYGAAPGYAPQLTLASRREHGSALLVVRDNGIGIPYEDQPRLYTPFFTTRAPGEGSGLGLSLGFDLIVKRHRGGLQVESVPGQYTEVRVTLPLGTAPAGVAATRAEAPA